MTTTTQRPTDAELVKLLRRAWNVADTARSRSHSDASYHKHEKDAAEYKAAADALEAAPALTFEERVTEACHAGAVGTADLAYRENPNATSFRALAHEVLRAAGVQ